MLASHAAKRHGQHLPPIPLPPVDFGNRKRVRYLIASHHSHESNAVPQDGSVVNNFYDNFVDIGVLVVDAPELLRQLRGHRRACSGCSRF